jgi:uncharacterized membrane protein YedE/YeeE
MKTILAALGCGIIFGLGLSISEMINPTRVIGFLDIAGEWDITLLLVMGSAVFVTVIGFPLVLKQPHPLLSEKFSLPTKNSIDMELLSGATLFGIGWGLAGLCPGPAVAALASLSPSVMLFVAAMLVGLFIAPMIENSLVRLKKPPTAA